MIAASDDDARAQRSSGIVTLTFSSAVEYLTLRWAVLPIAYR